MFTIVTSMDRFTYTYFYPETDIFDYIYLVSGWKKNSNKTKSLQVGYVHTVTFNAQLCGTKKFLLLLSQVCWHAGSTDVRKLPVAAGPIAITKASTCSFLSLVISISSWASFFHLILMHLNEANFKIISSS